MNDATIIPAPQQAESRVTLFGSTEPAEILTKAGKVANALRDVIAKQNLYTRIQNKDHVRVEGWTLCGSLLGIFPHSVSTRELRDEDGRLHGFEAHVEARTKSGEVVGSAIARCTKDETRWGKADEYAIQSMAQTRATSKALRMPLGWIVSLAGYDACPAEEMDGVRREDSPPDRTSHAGRVAEALRKSPGAVPPPSDFYDDLANGSPEAPNVDNHRKDLLGVAESEPAAIHAIAERMGVKGKALDACKADAIRWVRELSPERVSKIHEAMFAPKAS